MRSLRHHLLRRRWLAGWLIALALLMRIAVPAGYMPMVSGDAITIELCSGYGPAPMAMAMAMAMPGMTMPGMTDRHDGHGAHGKGETPCGFGALAAPSLAGADPIQLALALVFIVTAALLGAARVRIARVPRLRPPLRGPPPAA